MNMRKVELKNVTNAIEQIFIQACYELEPDVLAALKGAHEVETSQRAKKILAQLIENAEIAESERLPLCQDTGLAVVFISKGKHVQFSPADGGIFDAVNLGVQQGYENGALRKSVVVEPLNQRKNTDTNTPCVIHYEEADGDELKISVMAKGGGCENKSRFKMFNPTDSKDIICDWILDVVKQAGANACPPFVVGVGIGGDFEQCCMLSKKSLLREIGQHNKDQFYAQMETQLLKHVNALGLGPQGLGGDTTALAVQIETAPCHIASLPVAVNIECHSHRHKTIVL